MGNVLNSASANPSTIHSGDSTTATVNCDATTPGQLLIGGSSGFVVAPNSAPITGVGSNLDTEVIVKITGPKGDCKLLFSFFGSSTSTIVTIQ